MEINVENLTLTYGGAVAVRDLNLTIAHGESVVLLGQSGCGKTSTMRCIAGLETPAAGRITIGDDVLFDAATGVNRPSHRRNIGMVFQSYAIWPHMTVFDNVAFGLQMQRVAKAEIRSRVQETLSLVGLEDFADRGASQLSGGQMQRVALARSVVMRPSVMLLDEPLSNLDARLRHRLRGDLRELQTRLGLTTVYVTHDQEEALALADRIAMMQHGRIVQVGAPTELYARPVSASVADFLGVANVLPVEQLDAHSVRLAGTSFGAVSPTEHEAGQLRACIRAEDVLLSAGAAGAGAGASGIVTGREFLGPIASYRIALDGGVELTVTAGKAHALNAAVGDTVSVQIPTDAIQVLPLDVDLEPASVETSTARTIEKSVR